jgi:DNA-binding transcriptional MerR regulator
LDRTVDKAPDAFRTISEVADDLDLPQHVLRFWETRFIQIRPMKRGGGRRFYRREDVELLRGIRHLLYGEGYTIRGVQRILKDHGAKFVQTVWQAGAPQPDKIHTDKEPAPSAADTPAPERGRRLFGLLPLKQDTDSAASPPEAPSERSAPLLESAPPRQHAEASPPRRAPMPAAEGPADRRGAAPPHEPAGRNGLAQATVRKLEATLHELEECRRLIDDALDTAR